MNKRNHFHTWKSIMDSTRLWRPASSFQWRVPHICHLGCKIGMSTQLRKIHCMLFIKRLNLKYSRKHPRYDYGAMHRLFNGWHLTSHDSPIHLWVAFTKSIKISSSWQNWHYNTSQFCMLISNNLLKIQGLW